jgi:sugar lactone lactonase YvrE
MLLSVPPTQRVKKGVRPMDWQWETVAAPDGGITEGPAWDGSGLFFTSIGRHEIRRYDPVTNAVTTVYRDSSSATPSPATTPAVSVPC